MEHFNYKTGNILEYAGRLNHLYRKWGVIKKVEKIQEHDTFILSIYNHGTAEEIRAYADEVSPVMTAAKHLEAYGFVFNDQTRAYRNGAMYIIRPILTHGEGITTSFFDDKGWMYVNQPLTLPLTDDQIRERLTPITFLHALQNYFNDALNVHVNPAALL